MTDKPTSISYAQKLTKLKKQTKHYLKEVGDQWQTPLALYWGIFSKFGPFVLDLFSDGKNSKCPNYYTIENNALTQDWTADLNGKKGYANPPYSRSIAEDGQAVTGMRHIITKTLIERDNGAKLVYLIKSATSEVWWPENADHVCFIRGRISFDLPAWFIPANKNQEASSAGFACAIAVFDKEWKGERMGYINRDTLLSDGQIMLNMIEDAALKQQAKQELISKPKLSFTDQIATNSCSNSLIDLKEQVPKDLPISTEVIAPDSIISEKSKTPKKLTKYVWPNEVLDLVNRALQNHPSKFNSYRHRALCERANQLLLDKTSHDSVLTNLFTMLDRWEPIGEMA